MARMCISTLNPELGGGVPTMAKFVYEVAEEVGHNPYLAYNNIDLSKDIRLWDVPRQGLSVTPTKTIVDGMEARCVPRILPEFEFWHYVLNGDAWEMVIRDADIHFGVGGNNHCCHPFLRSGNSYGCWVATPLWTDRVDRIEAASLPRRIRDKLSKPYLKHLERHIYQNADVIYTLSEYTAVTISAESGIARNDVEVVPYPVDTEKFSPSDCEFGDSSRILFVGRFTDTRKNTPMLLKAFAKVCASIPDTQLRLIGDEPTPQLLQMVQRLNIQDSVEFIKYVSHDELPKFYQEADVFVIPSTQEGLAIVGLEAMACGTPVVATRCGGPEDYVIDGETGSLVPINDPEALANSLKSFIQNDQYRKRTGNAARNLIESQFSRAHLFNKFQKAFETLR